MKERTDIGKKYLRKKAWYFLKKGCLAYTTYNLVFCVADRKRYTYIWIRIPLSTLNWIRSRIQIQALLNLVLVYSILAHTKIKNSYLNCQDLYILFHEIYKYAYKLLHVFSVGWEEIWFFTFINLAIRAVASFSGDKTLLIHKFLYDVT